MRALDTFEWFAERFLSSHDKYRYTAVVYDEDGETFEAIADTFCAAACEAMVKAVKEQEEDENT